MVPAEHVCRNFRQQRRILPQLLKLLSTNAPLALPSFSIANRQQIPEGGPLYLLPFVPPLYTVVLLLRRRGLAQDFSNGRFARDFSIEISLPVCFE